ncbi:MAG: 7-carboxy-7-deazaguanine synthase QueE, partial [Bacteroidetes bacterium]|nr:7-carboxy-7-deazaguanine synthase QueE [Bacteroidota bacterium]
MEEFYTIQGEGYNTGQAAYFIRVGGCDVGCSWCDVKESWNASDFPPVSTDLIVQNAIACPAKSIVVTGGEPLLYNMDYLCNELHGKGI